jgi:hypothetical protein
MYLSTMVFLQRAFIIFKIILNRIKFIFKMDIFALKKQKHGAITKRK